MSPSSPAAVAPVKMPLLMPVSTERTSEVDASTRLPASRLRLRDSLLAIARPPPQPSLFADGIGHVGDRLLDRIKALPMASALLEGLSAWWQRNPLHRAAGQASTQLLGPVARRRPGAVVLIAVGSGILLAYARPWRWLLRTSNLFGAISQVIRGALRGPSAKAWSKAFTQGSVSRSTQ